MILNEKLLKISEASAKQIPAESQEIMERSTRAVADSVAGRSIPQAGDSLPTFEFSDSTGTLVNSVKLAERGPFVLSFFRGKW